MRRKRRPLTVKCYRCKKKIKVGPKGRVPTYCSRNCQQRTYERNHAVGPMILLRRDIATVQIRNLIRAEVLEVLRSIGLDPPPPPVKPKRKAHLHLV